MADPIFDRGVQEDIVLPDGVVISEWEDNDGDFLRKGWNIYTSGVLTADGDYDQDGSDLEADLQFVGVSNEDAAQIIAFMRARGMVI